MSTAEVHPELTLCALIRKDSVSKSETQCKQSRKPPITPPYTELITDPLKMAKAMQSHMFDTTRPWTQSQAPVLRRFWTLRRSARCYQKHPICYRRLRRSYLKGSGLCNGSFRRSLRNFIVGDVTRRHNHHILAHMGSFQYSRISLEQGPTELRISNHTWVTLSRDCALERH